MNIFKTILSKLAPVSPTSKEEKKSDLILLDQQQTQEVITKLEEMANIQKLESKMLELQKSFNIIISNQLQIQDMMVSLTTTVEEIVHSLEENDIMATNDFDTFEPINNNSEYAEFDESKNNDVMVSFKTPSEQNMHTNYKKYDVN